MGKYRKVRFFNAGSNGICRVDDFWDFLHGDFPRRTGTLCWDQKHWFPLQNPLKTWRILGSQFWYMGMDQYLLIPFLGGWTSIYQLFWCSPGVQGFDTLPYDLFFFPIFNDVLMYPEGLFIHWGPAYNLKNSKYDWNGMFHWLQIITIPGKNGMELNEMIGDQSNDHQTVFLGMSMPILFWFPLHGQTEESWFWFHWLIQDHNSILSQLLQHIFTAQQKSDLDWIKRETIYRKTPWSSW